MERQNKQPHIEECLILYMHAGGIKKKQCTNKPKHLILYAHCSMNNQSVKGVQNSKRLTC